MPKSEITLKFLIPTTSLHRVQDVMVELKKIIDTHRGENFFSTISGPYGGQEPKEVTDGKASSDGNVGRRDDAAAAFDDDGEPPKRKRGRPPGSTAKAARSASGDGDDDESTDSGEGDRGAKSDGTRKVTGKGAGEGKGGRGRAGGSGSDQRGNSKSSEVKDDWADEDGGEDDSGAWASEDDEAEEMGEEDYAKSDEPWPDELTPADIDKTVIQTLLGDHYKATGGKDRGLTFTVMEEAVGERQLGQIDAKKYRKLAKALLKDIAKYTYGLKKAK